MNRNEGLGCVELRKRGSGRKRSIQKISKTMGAKLDNGKNPW